MVEQLLDALINEHPFKEFIPHDLDALRHAHALLDTPPYDVATTSLLDYLEKSLQQNQALQASGMCLALLEREDWETASVAAALYLDIYPYDDWMMMALSLSLACQERLEEARVVSYRALEIMMGREGDGQTNNDTQSIQVDDLLTLSSEWGTEVKAGLLTHDERYGLYQAFEEALFHLDPDLKHVTINTDGVGKAGFVDEFTVNTGQVQYVSLDEEIVDPFHSNDATHRDMELEDLLNQVDLYAEELEPTTPKPAFEEEQRVTEILNQTKGHEEDRNQYVEVKSPRSMAFSYPQHNQLSFNHELLSELGLSASSLEVDDESLSDRVTLKTGSRPVEEVEVPARDLTELSLIGSDTLSVEESLLIDESTERMSLETNLSSIKDFELDQDESLLISESALLSENEWSELGSSEDPLLHPPSPSDPQMTQLPVGSTHIPDVSTTQWHKSKAKPEAERSAEALAEQSDIDQPDQQEPHRVKQDRSKLTPDLIRPSQRDDREKKMSNVGGRSALQRLAVGELNVSSRPPPLVSSPPSRKAHGDTPNRNDMVSVWRTPKKKEKEIKGGVWLLWGILILGSYFALVAAFHHKSAHLVRRAMTRSLTMNAGIYQELITELQSSVRHPIGRSIDLVKTFIPQSPLELRRNELTHHLAWVTTARWVLYGIDEDRALAIEMIERSLYADQKRLEGRAALALALWALGQPEAARAIILALPESDWRRGELLGWMSWQEGNFEQAEVSLKRSLSLNSVNCHAAHLLSLMITQKSPSAAAPYLRQLKFDLQSPDAVRLYAPHFTPDKESWASESRIELLKSYPPQMQRDLLELGIPFLIKRDDFIGLQTVKNKLSLNASSSAPLLIPSLILTLAQMNLEEASQLISVMKNAYKEGRLKVDDWGVGWTLWSSISGSSDVQLTLHQPEKDDVDRLARAAGQGVRRLLKPSAVISPSTQLDLSGVGLVMMSDWVGVERVSSPTRTGVSTPSQARFAALARSQLSPSVRGLNASLRELKRSSTSLSTTLVLSEVLLESLMIAAYDPQVQGRHALELVERDHKIPVLRWLSRHWRCDLLSKTSNFSSWMTSCEGARVLNPSDVRSANHLVRALEETGRQRETKALISSLPEHMLSPESLRLRYRLAAPELRQSLTGRFSADDLELMTAEQDLRMSALTRLYERNLQRLTRHEIYRGTWFIEPFGSAKLAMRWRIQAAKAGSLLALLDIERVRLLGTVSLMSRERRAVGSVQLNEQLKVEAGVETQLAHTISLYEAMRCFANEGKLDLHHYHPELKRSLTESSSAFKSIPFRPPPKRCKQRFTDATAPLKEPSADTIPIVTLSHAQLLISLGQVDKASKLLKMQIEREPTLFEARIAYILLLMRKGGGVSRDEIKWGLGPLLDPTQGGNLPLGMSERLQQAGML